MQYFAYIELYGIYLRTLNLAATSLIHHGGIVLDASHAAVKRNVSRGTSLREAKQLLGKDVVYAPYCADDHLKSAENWLNILVKYSDSIEALTQHSAILDLSRHPYPNEIASSLLSELHHAESLPIAAGIAPTPWLAKMSREHCDRTALGLGILPVEPIVNPSLWLAGQNVMQLEELPFDQRKRLANMGIQSVADVQNMPYAVLLQQFRRYAPKIRQVVEGKFSQGLKPNWPKESLSSTLRMEDCSDALQIDAALRQLSAELAAALCSSDKVAQGITLYLTLASNHVVEKHRLLPQFIQSASAILTQLRQLFSHCELKEEVQQIRVDFHNLQASPRRQMTLDSHKTRSVPSITSTLERIKQTFGEKAVQQASEITLNREQKVWKAWGDVYGWK